MNPREALQDEKDECWLSLPVAERIQETVRERNMIERSKVTGAAKRIEEREKTKKQGRPL